MPRVRSRGPRSTIRFRCPPMPPRRRTDAQRRARGQWRREMNVLLIGSGGREHALAMSLAKSPQLSKLFIAPGNPGTAQVGENVVLDVADHSAVVNFCRLMRIELVVVGPEQPLVE